MAPVARFRDFLGHALWKEEWKPDSSANAHPVANSLCTSFRHVGGMGHDALMSLFHRRFGDGFQVFFLYPTPVTINSGQHLVDPRLSKHRLQCWSLNTNRGFPIDRGQDVVRPTASENHGPAELGVLRRAFPPVRALSLPVVLISSATDGIFPA